MGPISVNCVCQIGWGNRTWGASQMFLNAVSLSGDWSEPFTQHNTPLHSPLAIILPVTAERNHCSTLVTLLLSSTSGNFSTFIRNLT